MIADDSQPGGYLLFRYAYEGEPYSDGEFLQAIGQFEHLLRTLSAEGALHPELQAVLTDAGLTGSSDGGASQAARSGRTSGMMRDAVAQQSRLESPREPRNKAEDEERGPEFAPEPDVGPAAPQPDGGLVLRQVEPLIEFSNEEKSTLFGGIYNHDAGITDSIQLAFRSKEGRIAASLAGYHAKAYVSHRLLCNLDGSIAEHDTDVQRNRSAWVDCHPEDERALVGFGTELFEVDLRTGDKTLLGARPQIARYLVVDGADRILTLSYDDTMRIWHHEVGQPLGSEPLLEHKVPARTWAHVAVFGSDAVLLPVQTDEGIDYELAKLVEKDSLCLEKQGKLVLEEFTPYPGRRWASRTVDGVDYVIIEDHWFVL